MEITKDTLISKILREYPRCIEVLDRYGMPCPKCMGASTDTVEDGAIMHGLDLNFLLKELNKCCIQAESAQD